VLVDAVKPRIGRRRIVAGVDIGAKVVARDAGDALNFKDVLGGKAL
jgi:hypothetical protein